MEKNITNTNCYNDHQKGQYFLCSIYFYSPLKYTLGTLLHYQGLQHHKISKKHFRTYFDIRMRTEGKAV
jgi:hypothetical protein